MSYEYGAVSAALITRTMSRKKCVHFSGAGASFCSKNNPKGLYEQEKLHLNNVDFLAFPIFFEIHCFVSVVIVSLIRMIFFGVFFLLFTWS